MKLVKGFSLLEVMLAMAISAGLTFILFQALTQSSLVLSKVVNTAQIHRNLTIVQQLWEREFSGIFSPTINWDPESEKNESESSPESKDKKSESEKKETPDKENATEKKEEKKEDKKTDSKDAPEKKPVPQPFVYELDATNNLKMFTFITTNPTVVYDEPQTRMVRVMYKLEPDPENASTFILVHQQSEDLDPKHFISGAYNAIRSYPILKGIKTLQCTFLIPKVEDEKEEAEGANKGPEEKKEDEKSSVKDKKEKKEKKARQFETLKEWKEEAEEEKEAEEEEDEDKEEEEE